MHPVKSQATQITTPEHRSRASCGRQPGGIVERHDEMTKDDRLSPVVFR